MALEGTGSNPGVLKNEISEEWIAFALERNWPSLRYGDIQKEPWQLCNTYWQDSGRDGRPMWLGKTMPTQWLRDVRLQRDWSAFEVRGAEPT